MKCAGKFFVLMVCVLCCRVCVAQSTITLHFNFVAGDKALVLDSGKYSNAAGEQFTVSLLQYFISNISFITAGGKQYIIPQDSCYFFVQADDSSSQYCTVHIPSGNYTCLHFMVGIDSLRCVSKIDQRKGVLDPSATDMYWGWNSGYIFFKIEGSSPSAPEDAAGLHKFRYHVGGFGGFKSPTINNIRNVQLDFTENELLKAENEKHSIIEINADVLKIFNTEHPIKIAEHSSVMFDPFSAAVANNYAMMFSIKLINNE